MVCIIKCINRVPDKPINKPFIMTTTLAAPWQAPLTDSISAEIAAEHAQMPQLGNLDWITNQIKELLNDQSNCSFECMHRMWYKFCLKLRQEKGMSPTNYRYALGFLVDWLVPSLVIMEGLKHKGGAWLAGGLEPLEKFQKMLFDICMYPRMHIIHDNYWENWMPIHGDKMITWHDEYDGLVQQARTSHFWLRRCLVPLGDDLVELIVSQMVPAVVKEMYNGEEADDENLQ